MKTEEFHRALGRRGRKGHGPQLLETVNRAIDVLEYLLEIQGDTGVSEVARATGQSPAGSYRILATLVSRGLADYDSVTQRYRIGARFLEFAFSRLERIDLRATAQPFLEKLVQVTEETAVLAIRYGDDRIYISQEESPHELRQTITLGMRLPLHVGASGRAILSAMSETARQAYLDRALNMLDADSHYHTEEFHKNLQFAIEHGYATSFSESFSDTRSIAAPIVQFDGEPVAALMLCGPSIRFSPERVAECGQIVRELANQISTEIRLGGASDTK